MQFCLLGILLSRLHSGPLLAWVTYPVCSICVTVQYIAILFVYRCSAIHPNIDCSIIVLHTLVEIPVL